MLLVITSSWMFDLPHKEGDTGLLSLVSDDRHCTLINDLNSFHPVIRSAFWPYETNEQLQDNRRRLIF